MKLLDFSRYAVEVTNNPPDLRTNDFESIESTLILKMDAWPNGQLDPTLDNVNYTCQSTSNEVGQGVKSTTQFGVECKWKQCFWEILSVCTLSPCELGYSMKLGTQHRICK